MWAINMRSGAAAASSSLRPGFLRKVSLKHQGFIVCQCSIPVLSLIPAGSHDGLCQALLAADSVGELCGVADKQKAFFFCSRSQSTHTLLSVRSACSARSKAEHRLELVRSASSRSPL
jgi:hypothetical protein